MRSMLLTLSLAVVLLAAGCVEEKSPSPASPDMTDASPIAVKITSPRSGEILSGSGEVAFSAVASGGSKPYTYVWTSNLNGALGRGESVRLRPDGLKKGAHTIIVQLEDSAGQRAQGSVQIRVI
ncbi:MAG TPA: hypothetical protein PLI05_08215 [Methanotrichaceae archaeon]|nr:hypothetical protein [Methanotrichaceae archaeon]HQF17033.1 hypothetical protein [Methanotrichaceae archaeon]HQI91653.1 hypothetical protein [Methanotrichaceae archaeon]HQJ29099.1 hypothetical protein [Methanotrichaceae archaeon]